MKTKEKILDEHVAKFFNENKMATFENVPNSVFYEAMEEYAEIKVKNLTLPQVSKCEEFEREALLLAKFLDWLESVSENSVDREWIQDYFKANNSC